MFADVHSHVLFGIDDGARSVEETRHLLKELRVCGQTHLAFTPHYYPYKRSLASFLEKREVAFSRVVTLPEAKDFCFTLGAEVYLTETLLNNEDLTSLCYTGTRFLLTELEYTDYFTDATKFRLLRLVEDFGVVPVLAHIDRYPFLWKDEAMLAELRRMGCRFQVNFSALTSFFPRSRARRLLRAGYLDFLGEDVHHSVFPAEKKKKIVETLQKQERSFSERVEKRAISLIFPHS